MTLPDRIDVRAVILAKDFLAALGRGEFVLLSRRLLSGADFSPTRLTFFGFPSFSAGNLSFPTAGTRVSVADRPRPAIVPRTASRARSSASWRRIVATS